MSGLVVVDALGVDALGSARRCRPPWWGRRADRTRTGTGPLAWSLDARCATTCPGTN